MIAYTSIIIRKVFDELIKEDNEVELIEFAGQVIEPCKACFACGEKLNCIHQNDMFAEVFEKMTTADAIILGSPVYSADVSANMKAFIERAAVVCDMNPGLLTHKIGASVASLHRGGGLTTIDTMNHFFLNHEMFVVGSTYWNMVYGQMSNDVLNDKEEFGDMSNFFLLLKLTCRATS